MPDYSKGKVYAIRSHSTDKIYIGSTIETLSSRMAKHRYDYKNNKGLSSSEILKFNDYYIELLCDFPCDRKEQLDKKEGEYIRQYKDKCVNRYIPGRTKKEYDEENYQNNKEHITVCHNQYYQNNKQTIAEQKKQYYNNNKAEISEKRNQKYTCECGGKYTNINKTKHNKTTKHINFINSSN